VARAHGARYDHVGELERPLLYRQAWRASLNGMRRIQLPAPGCPVSPGPDEAGLDLITEVLLLAAMTLRA
jgi:hypothetical protein